MLLSSLQLLGILALVPFTFGDDEIHRDFLGKNSVYKSVPKATPHPTSPPKSTAHPKAAAPPNSTPHPKSAPKSAAKAGPKNDGHQTPTGKPKPKPIPISKQNNPLVKGISIEGTGVASKSLFKEAQTAGYSKLAIRGYYEKWGGNPGGAIDPTFVKNSLNAFHAGYKTIDIFWFPCSGSSHKCKPYKVQAKELYDLVSSPTFKDIMVNRVYLQIEMDPKSNNWDYGHKGNMREAAYLYSNATATFGDVGIYSTPWQWGSIFGSKKAVLDTNIKLWWGKYDKKSSPKDLKPTFGGWKSAVAKRYKGVSSKFKYMFEESVFLQNA